MGYSEKKAQLSKEVTITVDCVWRKNYAAQNMVKRNC